MIMNMNEKGRQTKLLAAVAVIAMVVCALAVVMPSEDVSGTTATSGAEDFMSYQIGEGAVVTVDGTEVTLDEAMVAINGATENVTVEILKSFTVTPTDVKKENAALWFNNTNNVTITIEGNNNTITFAGTNNTSIIGFYNSGAAYSVENLNLVGTATSQHGINIVAANVDLDNISITGNNAAGITFNGGDSAVTDKEFTVTASNITTSGNEWGGINVDNKTGTAILNLEGTISIGEVTKIWSETDSEIKFGEGANFTKIFVDEVAHYVETIVPAGDNITNAEISAALKGNETVVALPAGTEITTELIPEIPAKKMLVVPADATIATGTTFTIAENGAIQFADADNISFNAVGGTEKVSVSIANASGNFTVTGGSVEISGDIEGMEISGNGTENATLTGATITGTVTISGSGTATINNVTVAEGGRLIFENGPEYTITGTFTNKGTIVNNSETPVNATALGTAISGTNQGNGLYKYNQDIADAGSYSIKYYVGATEIYFSFNPEFSGTVTFKDKDSGVVRTGTMTGLDVSATVVTVNESEFLLTGQGARVGYNANALSVTGTSTPITVDEVDYYSNSTVTVNAIGEPITISGIVAFGDVDVPYGKDAQTTYVTVPAGASLVILNGTETVFLSGTIKATTPGGEDQPTQGVIENNGTIYVYGTLALGSSTVANKCIENKGTVYAVNVDAVKPFVNNGKVTQIKSVEITVDRGYNELVANLGSGLPIVITEPVYVDDGKRLDIANETIYFSGKGAITVRDGGAMSITDSVFDKRGDSAAKITVDDGAKLDIVDSKIFMVVSADEKSKVTVDNADVTYDNTTSNVKVGYGTVLYLSGTPTDNVEVYGTLDVSGTVNITSGIAMNVYEGATLQVSGSLNVAGVVAIDGAATVNVTGTVTVSNEYGGAAINTAGKFTVDTAGTVTIDAADSRYGQDNYLRITGDKFVVKGTLVMEGTLSGAVQDKGTVTIDGKVDNAQIVVYDGITLTVTSVELAPTANKGLVITDNGAATAVKGKTAGTVEEGNTVTTAGAKNLTVSVAVKTVGSGEKRVYVSNMTVTGNINGDTTIESEYEYSKDNGYGVEVTGDVAVQKGTLTFGQDVLLSGNVTATAKGTDVSVSGELTVAGSIVMGGENNAVDGIDIVGTGVYNATGYTVTTETSEKDYVTYYYGAFDAIVLKIADADDDEITVYGTQELGADANIAADQTVTISRDATLTIGADFELTMADGSKMENDGTVEAEGKLAFANFVSTYGRSDAGIVAQVVVMADPARTYMSLTVAIEDGMTDITLYQDVVITEDLTIPAGVTVTGENKTFKVYAEENDVTLTVAGSLVLVDNSTFATAYENDASGNAYEVETVVTGNMIYSKTNAAGAQADPMYNIEGAHFESVNDVEDVYVISNVAYAAENCHVGTITITGSVSVGDVTFSADEDEGSLTVKVENIYDANNKLVKNSTLVAGTITLVRGGDNDATLDLRGANSGTVTGTIAAAVGSIDLSRANGVVFAATSDEVDGETVDVAGFTGTIYGDVTVATGTVTVGTVSIASETVGNETQYLGSLTVASGATLAVPDNATINGASDADEENLIVVDGTVVFDEGALAGPITVNGTMQVAEDFTLDDASIELNGTLAVAEEKELTVNDKIEMGAGSTITGDVSIEQGYIVAMPGADLTGATLNWNAASGESDVASTEYYVNGDLYATVYAQDRTQQIGILKTNEIDITGYDDVFGWYATQDDADKALAEGNPVVGDADGKYVGAIAQVFGAANVSEIKGTISQGTGLTIYIDGLTISNWMDTDNKYYLTVGTHTVTIAANANYSIDNATITFNGQTIQNGGTITVDADATSFTLSATGAVPSGQTVVIEGGSGSDMGLTDYLLIILVILIVIMAIIVALRLMRS